MCFYIGCAVVVQEESICESRPFELSLAQLICGSLLEGINGRSEMEDEVWQGEANDVYYLLFVWKCSPT